jgi:hypothetical protein
MAISDQRMTALEIINEVRRKSKLNPVTALDEDSFTLNALAYLNDVVSEISDFDNWQEQLRSVTVTAQSSVADYSIPVSAVTVVQNIHEVVWDDNPGEMEMVTLDTIRRLQRTGSYGEPTQWAVKGVDGNGNPYISVSPTPASAQAGTTFDMLVYEKPVFIVTAQTSAVPPFPGKLVVQGLLVKIVLDESDGEPTSRYQSVKQVYEDMLKESYNRYNGDSGSTVYFRPARGRR